MLLLDSHTVSLMLTDPPTSDPHDPHWLLGLEVGATAFLLVALAASISGMLRSIWLSYQAGAVRLALDPNPAFDTAPPTRKQVLAETLLDNLDHTLGNDGEPLDITDFWRSLRWYNAFTGVCVMLNLLVRLSPCFNPETFANTTIARIEWATELGATMYGLILFISLLLARSPRTHADSVKRLFLLATASFVCDLFAALQAWLGLGHGNYAYTATLGMATNALVFVAVGVTPTGPHLFRERARLYNRTVAEKLKEEIEQVGPNVIRANESIIGRFLSVSMLNVMRRVSQTDQIDLHELPVLPANLQWEPTIIGLAPSSSPAHSRFGPIMSLILEVVRPNRMLYIKHFCCILVELSLAYVPHFCLQRILAILDQGQARRVAAVYGLLWLLAWGAETVARLTRTYDLCELQIDRTVRARLSFVLYRKLLTRNTYYQPGKEERHRTDIAHSKAEILNLISSDVGDVTDLPYVLTNFIRLAIQLAIGCTYIWALLGPSGLWGIAFSFVTYPFAYLLARKEYRLSEKVKITADRRVSLFQEALQTISIIKMTASERFWFQRLDKVRQKGFRLNFHMRLLSGLSALLYQLGPTLVVVVAFAHYTLVAQQALTASIAFTSIAVFGETRSAKTSLPRMISSFMKQLVGAKRVALFLRVPEVEYLDEPVSAKDIAKESQPLVIQGDVTWASDTSSESTAFVLRDLDISFPRGQMTLVAGKYAAGKSLLLLALLGEVKLLRGHISYAVSPVFDPWQTEQQVDWTESLEGLAYVPQVPWLQSLSIRDNILFGLPMNVDRYKRVLHACALLPDLEVLQDGDLTEIGERGKILSGGQKARVSLARAVYSRASTILLDDVISAIDAQTTRHILKHCFQSALMWSRTVIIASHAVEALAPLADHAVYLEDGTAQWQGPGPKLLDTDHMAHLRSESPDGVPAEYGSAGVLAHDREDTMARALEDYVVQRAPLKIPRQILLEEKKVTGAVDRQHWIDLVRQNGGPIFFATYVIATCGQLAMPVVEGGVLKAWTNDTWRLSSVQWISAYTSAAVLSIAFTTSTGLLYWFGGFTARKRIYATMQDRVLRAKMSFFTKTRVGSIVQRFGDDLTISQVCSIFIGQFIQLGLGAVVGLASITYYSGWWVPCGLAAFVALCWEPAQQYRTSSRQIRRLSATTNGPVNAQYAETVAGAAVIRAFGAQSIFVRVLTLVTHIVILGSSLAVICTTTTVTGGQAGFILGFAESMVFQLIHGMEMLRSFDTYGVGLERLAEYQNLETEDIDTLIEPSPESSRLEDRLQSWPSEGQIDVSKLSARYAPDLPDILHDVSFSCHGAQRVGIVGSTGGGKSTLAKALFRFVDISAGKIHIDGEDTSTLPLDILRSRMGIIAQDPILLSGTLRLNLHVEGRYSDAELREALFQVQLIQRVDPAGDTGSETSSITLVDSNAARPHKRSTSGPVNVFENLDHDIESGGQNLSAGQKQLVVLARALLKKSKILILDEATASIDSKTDAEISRGVHQEFAGTTVLIIAHRLRTIMPCSKVLVMDQGRIVQQGSPLDLIKERGGRFESLCRAAGEDEFRHLYSLAVGVSGSG